MPNHCPECGAVFLGHFCPHCVIRSLRVQVTSLQAYNNEQMERRRLAEKRATATTDRLDILCGRALETWGETAQLGMCAEECAELGAEILRVLRGRSDHSEAMMEEAVDTFITVNQLRLLAPTVFEAKLREKMDRLERLLEASA